VQQEKEAQLRLQQLEKEAQDLEEDDDIDDIRPTQTKKSAFALLGEDNDENEHEDEDESIEDSAQTQDTPTQPTPASQSSKKKKKKKKKAKTGGNATEGTAQDEDIDEIDAALKELATDNNGNAVAATTSAGVDPVVEEANRLLAVDTAQLHAQNEMKRLFGRAALEQDEDEQPAPAAAGGNRRQQRMAQQMGLAQALRGGRQGGGRAGGFSAVSLRRNIFIQGKEEWPMATGGGLGMEVEEKRADGTVLYRYVHNTSYQNVQSQFNSCVATMDPNSLVALLRENPYHISTLLQVSEIAKHESDHATSGDLLERALFSFGRAAHSTFAKNLAEGKARFDFRRAENREFWLASWRYMQNLTMRATWRTVFEWGKLLISLSPEEDPYGLWLVLDQYALRSRQDLDYINISRNTKLGQVHGNLPNVQFSQALAEYRSGDKRKGRQALYTTIGKFPWVVARLLQEINQDAPPGVWGSEPRTDHERLHSELYATRAKDLWNTPETSSLLVEISSALSDAVSPSPPDETEITLREARHVLLTDNPHLIALIPRALTEQMTSASDVLPPPDGIESHLTSDPAAAARPRGGAHNRAEVARSMQQIFQDLMAAPAPADDDDANAAAAAVPEDFRREFEALQRSGGVAGDEGNAEAMYGLFERLMNTLRGGFGGGPTGARAGGVAAGEGEGEGEGEEWDDLGLEGDAGRNPRRARVEDADDDDDGDEVDVDDGNGDGDGDGRRRP
jgi:hypothetical protein